MTVLLENKDHTSLARAKMYSTSNVAISAMVLVPLLERGTIFVPVAMYISLHVDSGTKVTISTDMYTTATKTLARRRKDHSSNCGR